MLNEIALYLQTSPITLMAAEEPPPPPPPPAQYQLPACKTDLWDPVKGVFDLVIANLLGLAPRVAVGILIILSLVLVAAAAFEGIRRPVIGALLFVLGAAVLAGFLITVATTFITPYC